MAGRGSNRVVGYSSPTTPRGLFWEVRVTKVGLQANRTAALFSTREKLPHLDGTGKAEKRTRRSEQPV